MSFNPYKECAARLALALSDLRAAATEAASTNDVVAADDIRQMTITLEAHLEYWRKKHEKQLKR